jgi:hypothetical protein
MLSFFIICHEFTKYSFKRCINKIEKKIGRKKTLLPMFFVRTLYTSPPWKTLEGRGHGEPAPTLVPSLSWVRPFSGCIQFDLVLGWGITMVRSNLKENSLFLPWYQCGRLFTQCKGRETTAPSQVSPTKVVCVMGQSEAPTQTLRDGWWVDRKYFFLGFQFPSPKL